jgi:hypothetical protein
MGMFPYTCNECGGAYERCGTTHYNEEDDDSCEECGGGQFCWEDEVIAVGPIKWYAGDDIHKQWVQSFLKQYKKRKPLVLQGRYEGYGELHVTLNELPHNLQVVVVPVEFEEYLDGWYKHRTANKIVLTCKTLYCYSCYPKLDSIYRGPITENGTKYAPSFHMMTRNRLKNNA